MAEGVRRSLGPPDRSWELVVVDQATAATPATPATSATRGDDAAAVAAALAGARGRWVTVLCDGESLAPTALDVLGAVVDAEPDAALVYADALVSADTPGPAPRPAPDPGRRVWRPAWSPARLLAEDWVGAPWVVRRSLLDDAVLADVAAARSAWRLALLIGVTAGARRVVHVPEALAVVGSPARTDGRPDVDPAHSRTVVRRAMAAEGRSATVEGGAGSTRLLRRAVQGAPLVSVVIPSAAVAGEVRGQRRVYLLGILADLVERTTYRDVQVVVIAGPSVGDDVVEAARGVVGDRLQVVRRDGPFSFSGAVDLGVAAADGEMVLLLNDDVEVLDPGWLTAMVALAQDPDVGLVGATLVYGDGTLQHAGHLYRGPRRVGHIGLGAGPAEVAADPSLLAERECSGVTAACALLRRDRFVEVGGFSPLLPVTYNDVDFCLKIRQRGWRIVCTPAARLHHFETRSRRPGVGQSEQTLVVRRWGRLLERDDPYWPAADRRVPEPAWAGLGQRSMTAPAGPPAAVGPDGRHR